jgi:hemerythrin-like domain-containing protein
MEVARNENQAQVVEFAEKLKQHAKTEEEVTYPTALLIGEYLKLKLN